MINLHLDRENRPIKHGLTPSEWEQWRAANEEAVRQRRADVETAEALLAGAALVLAQRSEG